MAEALGVAASALQITDAAIRLRELWVSIKDAPEDISYLVSEIALYADLLADIREQHRQLAPSVAAAASWDRCFECCQVAAKTLQRIADDLDAGIKRCRLKGSFRAFLKKEVVGKWRQRLESAKISMLAAQQTYSAAIQVHQNLLLVQEFRMAFSSLAASTCVGPSAEIDVVPPDGQFDALPENDNQTIIPSRKWQSLNRPHQETRTYTFRFRTPTWFIGKVLDIAASRSSRGWNLNLSSCNLVPENCRAFELARCGDIEGLKRLLVKGEASLYDRNPWGETLLHCAAIYKQLSTCRFLIDLGADISNRTFSGRTPFFEFLNSIRNNSMKNLEEAIDSLLVKNQEEDLFSDGAEQYLLATRFWIAPDKEVHLAASQKIVQLAYPPWNSTPLYTRASVALDFTYTRCNPDPDTFWTMLGNRLDLEDALRTFSTRHRNTGGPLDVMAINFGKQACSDNWAQTNSDFRSSWGEILRTILKVNSDLDIGEDTQSSIPLIFYKCNQVWGTEGKLIEDLATDILRQWVRWLREEGADLQKYGQQEHQKLRCKDQEWGFRLWRRRYPSFLCTARIVGFTYGPEVEDWRMWFSTDCDEWAGDFWNWVENPEMFLVPGSWVYD